MKNAIILLLSVVYLTIVSSAEAQQSAAVKPGKPRLVVGLVIDQMRWDYLYRFQQNYGDGGFNRLINNGRCFENAFIPYAPTITAAGHASIYTGSVPAIHGIVGNEWIDISSGKYQYCTSDDSVQAVGGSATQGKMSPAMLLATTIGDELKMGNNFESKVFGVSLKDRGAIFPAGRTGDAAYWFDDSSGNWISSTWYMKELPGWVRRFNDRKLADKFLRAGWQLSLPLAAYQNSMPDESEFEVPITKNGNTAFPHLKGYAGNTSAAFRYMPMSNSFTFDFSKTLILEEKLGKGPVTDLFCISLSAPDYIGHKFGPNSLEIEDTYVRLDKDLASFFSFLDKEIGKDGYLLFLTADHGGPAIPDLMKSRNLNAGNLNNYGLVKKIDKILFEQFGREELITHYYNNQFFLNRPLISELKLKRSEVVEQVIKYLESREEVVMAFDYRELNSVVLPAELKEKIAGGFFPKRCGDVYVILQPQFSDYLGRGTEHGTFYNYDAHVPLIFYGNAIPEGKSYRRVGITDIAPTLAALLEIQMPNGSVGEVLEEVVR